MANDVMSKVMENGYVLDINKNDTVLKGIPNTVSSNGLTH